MNILYKNQHGDSVYPFTSNIPFPAQCISYIKLVLKKSVYTPFVSTIACNNGQLFIQLTDALNYLGRFQLKDSVYATLNNQEIFGFVQVAKIPTENFYFNGKWQLDRSCYTFATALKGLQAARVQNNIITQGDLQLQFIGDFTLRESSNSQVINIGRDTQSAHPDYTEGFGAQLTQMQTATSKYVTSINGYSVQRVNIGSVDETISIQGPVPLIQAAQTAPDSSTNGIYSGSGTYVLYVNSLQGFPACLQESEADTTVPDNIDNPSGGTDTPGGGAVQPVETCDDNTTAELIGLEDCYSNDDISNIVCNSTYKIYVTANDTNTFKRYAAHFDNTFALCQKIYNFISEPQIRVTVDSCTVSVSYCSGLDMQNFDSVFKIEYIPLKSSITQLTIWEMPIGGMPDAENGYIEIELHIQKV